MFGAGRSDCRNRSCEGSHEYVFCTRTDAQLVEDCCNGVFLRGTLASEIQSWVNLLTVARMEIFTGFVGSAEFQTRIDQVIVAGAAGEAGMVRIHEGKSVFVPRPTLYHLANPGIVPLEIIEVSNGGSSAKTISSAMTTIMAASPAIRETTRWTDILSS